MGFMRPRSEAAARRRIASSTREWRGRRREGGDDNCFYKIRICATPIAARPDGLVSRGDLDDAKAKDGVRLRIANGTEGFPYLNRL